MKQKIVVVKPAAGRTASALRGLGYEFDAAVCDLIDNSISAKATLISCNVGFGADGDLTLSLIDNGCGMDQDALLNAIRIGSEEREDPNSLGKFGFGLKTASTAFCRALEVTTREKGKDRKVFSTTYDIDHIIEVNEWEVKIGGATKAQEDDFLDQLEGLAHLGSEQVSNGTLVRWKKIDRLLVKENGEGYADPARALKTKRENAIELIGTVFHRFLNPEDERATNIKIFVDGEIVEFWDPFCEGFSKKIKPEIDKSLDVYDSETKKEYQATIRGFILPLDKEEIGWENSVHHFSQNNQGIYAYRENRLVDGPDWFRISAKEPHVNQLRIELSFTAEIDEAFGVSVTKDRLVFPTSVFALISDIVRPLIREADQITRAASRAKTKKKRLDSAKKVTDAVIGNTLKELDRPNVIQDDKKFTLVNNTEDPVDIVDSKGVPQISISVREVEKGVHVIEEDNLDDGVLWQPGVGGGAYHALLNVSHDWYRKSYFPSLSDSKTTDAVEYLLYALALAELNNTDLSVNDMYEQFRVEVSRNLRKLVRHLPNPDD
jgi:hypothetical protein